MNYPFDKYRFAHTMTKKGEHKVIALSTYAGKTVRGVAICSADDSFSLDKGKELAAARCALKVARKRVNRADDKLQEAVTMSILADKYLEDMQDYFEDAIKGEQAAEDALSNVLNRL